MEDSYIANDEEFKKLYNQPEEKNDEKNEDQIEKENKDQIEEKMKINSNDEYQNDISLYNKADFKLDNVLTFFFKNEILAGVQYCPKCGKQMILENNKNIWIKKFGDVEQN